jgi:hypothetical protein
MRKWLQMWQQFTPITILDLNMLGIWFETMPYLELRCYGKNFNFQHAKQRNHGSSCDKRGAETANKAVLEKWYMQYSKSV